MIQFRNDLTEIPVNELYLELGIADYTYVELANYLQRLEEYRSHIHNELKRREINNEQQRNNSSLVPPQWSWLLLR